jgi:hypothetical protein
MVSREFIRYVIKSHHEILVHMTGEERLDGLSSLIFVIHNLVLNENEGKELIMNTFNRIDTHGLLRVKAIRTSQVDVSLIDSNPREYIINTKDIVEYQTVNTKYCN